MSPGGGGPLAVRFAESSEELHGPRGYGAAVRLARRRAALTVLGSVPRRPAPGVRIVHYHHVFGDEREGFARQLDYFRRAYEPVSLGEATRRLETGSVEGRELVVTFDDGFRNLLTDAAPMLGARGMVACFFLMTDLVEAPPERVAVICRERLLHEPVEPLSWDGARELLALGHEIGSHTKSHPNLQSLGQEQLDDEIAGSKEELEERLGAPVLHFSAPYGDARSFGSRVSAAARAAGYASCSSARRGLNPSGSDRHALRRHHLLARWPLGDVRYFLERT